VLLTGVRCSSMAAVGCKDWSRKSQSIFFVLFWLVVVEKVVHDSTRTETQTGDDLFTISEGDCHYYYD